MVFEGIGGRPVAFRWVSQCIGCFPGCICWTQVHQWWACTSSGNAADTGGSTATAFGRARFHLGWAFSRFIRLCLLSLGHGSGVNCNLEGSLRLSTFPSFPSFSPGPLMTLMKIVLDSPPGPFCPSLLNFWRDIISALNRWAHVFGRQPWACCRLTCWTGLWREFGCPGLKVPSRFQNMPLSCHSGF